jgi:hypothetical protein
MARVTGKNGAVTMPSGMALDAASWNVNGNMPGTNDTSYADTNPGGSYSGCGTVNYSFGIQGFLKSNVASSAPGVGVTTNASAFADADGSSITLTAHTSCTFTGTAIMSDFSIGHSKQAGAIPISYGGNIDGDLTEAWAVS